MVRARNASGMTGPLGRRNAPSQRVASSAFSARGKRIVTVSSRRDRQQVVNIVSTVPSVTLRRGWHRRWRAEFSNTLLDGVRRDVASSVMWRRACLSPKRILRTGWAIRLTNPVTMPAISPSGERSARLTTTLCGVAIMKLRITIICSTLALVAAFGVWPEIKEGVLIGRQAREIDRPYGTAYINVCSYFTASGIAYTIYPAEVIPTRKKADMAICPFNKGQSVASGNQIPGREPNPFNDPLPF